MVATPRSVDNDRDVLGSQTYEKFTRFQPLLQIKGRLWLACARKVNSIPTNKNWV